jgi:hypothetical protein
MNATWYQTSVCIQIIAPSAPSLNPFPRADELNMLRVGSFEPAGIESLIEAIGTQALSVPKIKLRVGLGGQEKGSKREHKRNCIVEEKKTCRNPPALRICIFVV